MATVADSMTRNPITMEADGTVREAAELMAAADIGDVVVVEEDRLVGIVTDRDIVVRVLAQGGSPDDPVRDALSEDPVTTAPDVEVGEAVRLMRNHAVRRVPVVEADGRLVGIVSLGDLAVDHDPGSALADISDEPPDE